MCFWQRVSSGGEEKESRGKPKEQSQTFRGNARPNQACLASMHFSTVPQESQDLGTRQDPVQYGSSFGVRRWQEYPEQLRGGRGVALHFERYFAAIGHERLS